MFNRWFESGLLYGSNENSNNTSSSEGKKQSLVPKRMVPSSKSHRTSSSSGDLPPETIPKNLQPLPVNNMTITQQENNLTLNSNRLILVKNLSDFSVNSQFVFNDEDSKRLFAVFRTRKNKIYAMDEKCYHMGGPLEKGDIEDLMVYYDSTKTKKEHPCVVCPWHHYYISLKTGESFYLDLDRKYKSKGQRQRTYPLYYHPITLDLYLELDHRLELNQDNNVCECTEHNHQPLQTLDSDHYVKIHQQQQNQTDSKPHSVVNLKELREKREQQKTSSFNNKQSSSNLPPLIHINNLQSKTGQRK